jgi:hypothetical protein
MTWLEFWAAVIGDVLSWPVAVLVIVLLMRKHIRGLLNRLRHSKIFGNDFEFGDGVARAEVATAQALADAESEASESSSDPGAAKVYDEAQSNPSGVIIRAWEQLAGPVAVLHHAAGLDPTNRRGPVEWARDLVAAGVVNSAFVASIVELQDLRNQVAHGRHEPNVGEAAAYAETAREITRAAEALGMRMMNFPGGPPRPVAPRRDRGQGLQDGMT